MLLLKQINTSQITGKHIGIECSSHACGDAGSNPGVRTSKSFLDENFTESPFVGGF